MKKIIIIAVLFPTIVFAAWWNPFSRNEPEPQFGSTVLKVPAGGTGASTFAAGECLKGNGTSAVTTGACGGGGGSAAWEKYTGISNPSSIITPTTTNASVYVSGNSTTTGTVNIGSLNAASCDVKSDTNGLLSCGTDATGGGTGSNWSYYGDTTLTPSTSPKSIFVPGASSTVTTLRTDNFTVAVGSTFPADDISESEVNFSTVCATGNHLYVSGGNLACEDSFTGKTTANLSENTNLYWTQARFDTALSASSTVVTEADFGGLWTTQTNASSTIVTNNDFAGLFNTNFSGKTTNDLTENTNLYYTAVRVNDLINASTTIPYGLCTNGQIMKSNGTIWQCAADATSAGGGDGGYEFNLVGSNLQLVSSTPAKFPFGTLASSTSFFTGIVNYGGATTTQLSTTDLSATGMLNFPVNSIIDAMIPDNITITEADPQVGTLTGSNVCQGDGSAVQCNLTEDGTGACAAGAVCLGGHTHADGEVADALTINTAIEGLFTGGIRATPVNATTTNVDFARIYTTLTYNRATGTSNTTTDYMYLGADGAEPPSWDFKNGDLFVGGASWFGDKATSSLDLWLGTGGTANSIDLTGGDLYVQDDVEIDGSLFVNSVSTTTATTTIGNGMKVYKLNNDGSATTVLEFL